MSTLVVQVTPIERIYPHPNADRLELAHVLGWQVVVLKGQHQVGEKVAYFPPDTVIPEEWVERFGVGSYVAKGRIRCAKLRGEPSFGLVVSPDDPEWPIGLDVADHYGATKYRPPLRADAGDVADDHPAFNKYTDLRDLRNFPAALEPGEMVVVVEKLDGTNCRVGIIDGEWMAGSREYRRQMPRPQAFIEAKGLTVEEPDPDFWNANATANNTYWYPLTLPSVRALLEHRAKTARRVILFGEVYSNKVGLSYGAVNEFGFRAFDLLVDGKYLSYADLVATCDEWGVERVPEVAVMPYDLGQVRRLSTGPTLMPMQAPHRREGVVIRPTQERYDSARVVLKYVSDAQLFSEEPDFTDA